MMIAAISRQDDRIEAARVQWECSRGVLVMVAEPTIRPLRDLVVEAPCEGASLGGLFKFAEKVASASDGSGNSLLVIGLERQFIWCCHLGEFWLASRFDDSRDTMFLTRDHGMAAAINADLCVDLDVGAADTVSSRYLLPNLIPSLSSEVVPLPMAGDALLVGCSGKRPAMDELDRHALMSIRLQEVAGAERRFVAL